MYKNKNTVGIQLTIQTQTLNECVNVLLRTRGSLENRSRRGGMSHRPQLNAQKPRENPNPQNKIMLLYTR